MDRVQMETGVTGPDAPTPEEPQAERPEWLPEKFNSAEDLATAYSELESKMGQQPEAEAQPEEVVEETNEESTGLFGENDVEKYNAEFSETGTLSDETVKNIVDKGLPEEFVRTYVDGLKALASQAEASVYNTVGGEESYNNMMEWATENLSDAEIEAYNNTIAESSNDARLLAVQGLHARFTQSEGTSPSLFKGKATGTATNAFGSWQQVSEAMRNPKYTKDPAYRKEIQQRLSISNLS